MDADFAIELGRDDPVLDFPWSDPADKLRYFDLKRRPELIAQVEEAQRFPELTEFLRTVNSTRSLVESAKCDAWATNELSAEEDDFHASHKFASYVDLVFSSLDHRQSFPFHERFARRLIELLRRAPKIAAAVEVCMRRCYFHDDGETRDGFYCTLYVSGYGNDEATACRSWAVALSLTGNAIVQLSSSG